MDLRRLAKFVTALFLFAAPVYAEGSLVLMVDMSDSIDDKEAQYQMESYVNVLSSVPAIEQYKIDVIIYSENFRHVVSQGTVEEAIDFFSGPVQRPRGGLTNIADPVKYVVQMYNTLEQPVIMDITGDGPHNCSDVHGCENDVHPFLDQFNDLGGRVNTLFIGSGGAAHIDEYTSFSSMERDGFSLQADDIMYFELALFDKLVLELAMMEVRR